ncbi:MAG: hypothetical protein GKB99_01215 [Methanocellales archaeon]|nr:hypothetical protein [Methanocellales archaeon]
MKTALLSTTMVKTREIEIKEIIGSPDIIRSGMKRKLLKSLEDAIRNLGKVFLEIKKGV